MKKIKIVLSLWIVIAFSACHRMNSTNTLTGEDSKVLSFEYTGEYGDNICATIIGTVFTQDSKGKLQPLPGARIEVEGSDSLVITDSQGEFEVCLPGGVYILEVSKPGFQSIRLQNYRSQSDEFSQTEVLLMKGSGETIYNIANRTKKRND